GGALARRALWEDLHNEHRELAADVLRESGDGSIDERMSAWIAHNAAPVERCLQVLADVKAEGPSDLATLSVAVREIRNLITATSAPQLPDPASSSRAESTLRSSGASRRTVSTYESTAAASPTSRPAASDRYHRCSR